VDKPSAVDSTLRAHTGRCFFGAWASTGVECGRVHGQALSWPRVAYNPTRTLRGVCSPPRGNNISRCDTISCTPGEVLRLNIHVYVTAMRNRQCGERVVSSLAMVSAVKHSHGVSSRPAESFSLRQIFLHNGAPAETARETERVRSSTLRSRWARKTWKQSALLHLRHNGAQDGIDAGGSSVVYGISLTFRECGLPDRVAVQEASG
jgi:hypothetical protein